TDHPRALGFRGKGAPGAPCPSRSPDPPPGSVAADSETESRGKGEETVHRVLIADSDRGLARLCRRALEGSGSAVETAADGLECLSRLRAFRPNLLVLEPELPWGSGEGVLAV